MKNKAEYSVMMCIQPEDMADLKTAKWLLENPGIAAKITDFLGIPIQKGFKLLPKTWSATIGAVTRHKPYLQLAQLAGHLSIHYLLIISRIWRMTIL